MNTKRGILPGYFESLQQKESKERYLEKLKSIEGQDPYEISRKEWIDDVDCWPDVTYINVGMYLLFAASPYTQEQLMNYKSLDCYQNFANGWVREVLCKKFGENRDSVFLNFANTSKSVKYTALYLYFLSLFFAFGNVVQLNLSWLINYFL